MKRLFGAATLLSAFTLSSGFADSLPSSVPSMEFKQARVDFQGARAAKAHDLHLGMVWTCSLISGGDGTFGPKPYLKLVVGPEQNLNDGLKLKTYVNQLADDLQNEGIFASSSYFDFNDVSGSIPSDMPKGGIGSVGGSSCEQFADMVRVKKSGTLITELSASSGGDKALPSLSMEKMFSIGYVVCNQWRRPRQR